MKNIIEDTVKYIKWNDSEHYVEIEYVGWVSKGLKLYKISVWKDECCCIFDQLKRFKNIQLAIVFIKKHLSI